MEDVRSMPQLRKQIPKMTPEQQKLAADNHNLIYGFLNKYKLSHDEYYDVAAYGFCRACQTWDSNKEHGSKLSAYAYHCMYNSVKMQWRQNGRNPAVLAASLEEDLSVDAKGAALKLEDVLFDATDEMGKSDEISDLKLAMNVALNDTERKLIELSYWGEVKQWELAARTGLSQSYVSRILKRAKAKLRRHIDKESGDKKMSARKKINYGEVRRLLDEGNKPSEVARIMGCSSGSILKFRNENHGNGAAAENQSPAQEQSPLPDNAQHTPQTQNNPAAYFVSHGGKLAELLEGMGGISRVIIVEFNQNNPTTLRRRSNLSV